MQTKTSTTIGFIGLGLIGGLALFLYGMNEEEGKKALSALFHA